jgi:predicted nucleotide-binding protein
MAAKKATKRATDKAKSPARAYLSQDIMPAVSIDEALRVPRAIVENYASAPTRPLSVASALTMSPTSGTFRTLTGAAIAYGLTKGGAWADLIEVEPLAKRILKPKDESEPAIARREAFLRPNAIRDFLTKYDGSPLPRPDIAHNVLQEMGIPPGKCADVHELIVSGARSLGLVSVIKGKDYADLRGTDVSSDEVSDEIDEGEASDAVPMPRVVPPSAALPASRAIAPVSAHDSVNRRVFITHGKNRKFLETIKKFLAFGELEAVVSVDHSSVSQPVPEKVMGEMRSCGAAIIHVDAETKCRDENEVEHVVLNPNVLVEIGAAMALYGRRFILLTAAGIKLPSNLQGVFEVRYSGDELSADESIKLMESIRDIKNHPIPSRYVGETPQAAG